MADDRIKYVIDIDTASGKAALASIQAALGGFDAKVSQTKEKTRNAFEKVSDFAQKAYFTMQAAGMALGGLAGNMLSRIHGDDEEDESNRELLSTLAGGTAGGLLGFLGTEAGRKMVSDLVKRNTRL
jgi:hypothetical protein